MASGRKLQDHVNLCSFKYQKSRAMAVLDVWCCGLDRFIGLVSTACSLQKVNNGVEPCLSHLLVISKRVTIQGKRGVESQVQSSV